MPTIFDNIENFLETGLNKTLDKARRADFVVALREEGKLSIISQEEIKYKAPQIICSIGLVKKEK